MVKIILEGWFQCSPDDYSKEMKVIGIENDALQKLIEAGWKVAGAYALHDRKDIYDIEGKEKQIRELFTQHDELYAQYKFNSEDKAALMDLILFKIKVILEDLPRDRRNGV